MADPAGWPARSRSSQVIQAAGTGIVAACVLGRRSRNSNSGRTCTDITVLRMCPESGVPSPSDGGGGPKEPLSAVNTGSALPVSIASWN